MALAARDDLGKWTERTAHKRYRWHASLFQVDGVDDAPRRGRAAMANAADREIGFRRHLVDERRAFCRKALAPEFELRDAIVAAQRGGECVKNDVGKFLTVIEKADAQSLQRF